MMKDKELEGMFLTLRPQFDDKEEFMACLTQKLNAIDYLRQNEEAKHRRYKYAMIGVFVLGMVIGGTLLALVSSTPSELPLFTFFTSSGIMSSIGQLSRMIVTAIISLALGSSIISIVSNILDIVQMRDSLGSSLV